MVLKNNPLTAGKKKVKNRITLGLACNMDGTDEQKPVVIKKNVKTSVFQGDPKFTSSLF